ncbi:MAG: hypothetical protein JWQ21_998 [Herminiimonas sp.]|nr:hypothetical protein [Herminiimonas sp.]
MVVVAEAAVEVEAVVAADIEIPDSPTFLASPSK